MANKKSLMEAFEVEPKVFSSNEDVNDYDVFRNKNLLEELRVKIVQNLMEYFQYLLPLLHLLFLL